MTYCSNLSKHDDAKNIPDIFFFDHLFWQKSSNKWIWLVKKLYSKFQNFVSRWTQWTTQKKNDSILLPHFQLVCNTFWTQLSLSFWWTLQRDLFMLRLHSFGDGGKSKMIVCKPWSNIWFKMDNWSSLMEVRILEY